MSRIRQTRKWQLAWLILLLVLLFLVMFLRYHDVSERRTNHAVTSVPSTVISTIPASHVPSLQPGTPSPGAESPTLGTDESTGNHYTEETYQLVSDIVHLYRTKGAESGPQIDSMLNDLSLQDPALGVLWEGIMQTWRNVNEDFVPSAGIAQDLPSDESLCFVVLGFQLLYDGTMAPELLGRCEAALSCAEQYPHSRILLCGGATAPGNPESSEASVMADWLCASGISPGRLILENRSLTTVENAAFGCQILAEQYPEVSNLVIISSDYHLPLGILLFQEATYLWQYEKGNRPYEVVSCTAYITGSGGETFDVRRQASELWSLADPVLSY